MATCYKDVGAIGVWKAGASKFVAPDCIGKLICLFTCLLLYLLL